MKVSSKELLHELTTTVKEHRDRAVELSNLDLNQLNRKPDETAWSALECIEHLNRYGRFYLPEIERQMNSGQEDQSDRFKSSWLGEYFAQSMLPKEKLNKMNTFASMNPAGSDLGYRAIEEFIEQQHTMLRLLHNAENINLSKVKTGISISKWIKLRLGDTFRVVIYHNMRHMAQIERALKA